MRLLAAAAVVCALAGHAHAGRYGLVIGANTGDPSDQPLRYAESDARRVADVLVAVGHFAPGDVTVLTNTSEAEVRRALRELDARARQDPERSMLFVFYSGHADNTALHLAGTHLRLDALRELVTHSPAATRLIVIDACRAGTLTRLKGGRPGASFAVKPPPIPLTAQGMAILASSSAFEDSQESDQLKSSFFTHYFLSALRGAADANRDGRVTLSEAFAYTAERTLAATSASREGPQHPTYRFELAGQDELVLAQLAASGPLGYLEFAVPGEYFVRQGDAAGSSVAEVAVGRGASRRVVVPEGRYHVSRRSSDHLLQGTFSVGRGGTTAIDPARMERVAYARVVRKGITERHAALSVFTVGGVRGPILGIGAGWHAGVGGRLDLSAISLELRVGGGRSSETTARLAIDSRELQTSAVALRAFDLGRVTLGAGLELGGLWLAQRFSSPTPSRDAFGAIGGPIGVVEVPLGRWYARGEVAALTYIVRVGNDPAMTAVETPLALRGALGLGAYF